MPTPAALAREDYTFDAMISYLQTIERHRVWSAMTRPEATLESVQPYLERDVPVFAFEAGATSLMTAGLDLEPVTLPGSRLTDRIRELPGVDRGDRCIGRVVAHDRLPPRHRCRARKRAVQPYQVVVATTARRRRESKAVPRRNRGTPVREPASAGGSRRPSPDVARGLGIRSEAVPTGPSSCSSTCAQHGRDVRAVGARSRRACDRLTALVPRDRLDRQSERHPRSGQ
jgi:hypothetical protein